MSQEDHQDDLALAYAAAKALRQSETVDSKTAAKLLIARRRALAVAGTPSVPRRLLVPAGAFAAMALAVIALRTQHVAPASLPVDEAHNIDALDLLTDEMSPSFYRDLEFYQWLEKEQPHA